MDFFAAFIHWSFFAVAVALAFVGDFIKRLVIPGATIAKPTRQAGERVPDPSGEVTPTTLAKWPWWRRLYYRTLPLHPVVVGTLLGLAMGGVAPDVVADKPIARVLYYATAGIFCTWVYSGMTQWVKRLGGPG